jgi:hypothetical protein
VAEKRGNRGARAAIDWEAAFAYYAALPPSARSYAAVAAEFGVSVRTVETHGRTEQWKTRLRAIKEETRARTAETLIDARVEQVEKLRLLIDASLVSFADGLRNGMRMTPADLERFNRLSLALIEEATTAQLIARDEDEAPPERTMEHANAVLDALAEVGALEALGLARIPDETDDPSLDEGGTDDEQR